MKTVGYLLPWLLFAHILQGRSEACISSGFPERDRLVTDVVSRTGPFNQYYTQLIPEMTFICNGTIVGFTVAIDLEDGEQDPMIQIWRSNGRESQPCVYYKAGADIPIDGAVCVDGLINVSSEVFHCKLNRTAQVSVQPGDILGLELPPFNDDDVALFFARVGRGPVNYVFREQLLSSPVELSTRAFVNRDLPQITLEVESEISSNKCTSGFPDIPVSEVERRGLSTTIVTVLIPDMNFTCNGTLAGFTFVGSNTGGEQDPNIQIWRENSSQPGVYHKAGQDITVNFSDIVCADGLPQIDSQTFLCILNKAFQVTVQPGDILGIELAPTDDDDFEIWFTSGGPTNHVFRQQLNSTIDLSSSDLELQQLPQITFALTSDECTSGFPDVALRERSGRGDDNKVTTQLFPEMRFGCRGTIVRLTAAVVDRTGQQVPKIQIWRENNTQPGVYYKPGPDIPVVGNSSICARHRISGGIFRCTLSESAQVSVQPGDVLGIELPPTNDDDFDIYFVSGGPINYVFEKQPNSDVINISEANNITNDLPQITLLVMLDDIRSASINGLPPCIPTATSPNPPVTDTTTDTTTGSATFFPISSTVGIILSLMLIIIVISIILVVGLKTKKQCRVSIASSQAVTLQQHFLDAIPQVKSNEAYATNIVTDRNVVYETTSSSLWANEEDDAYWEPADTVNDLYRQLSSKKYREIVQQDVEITKTIGSGQFGTVSKGVWQSPMGAMDVAVKQLRRGASEEETITFLKEATINGQFRHPNVVKLMGVVTMGEQTMIVLELLSNGDLCNFLVKQQPLSERLESFIADKQLLLRFCQHIASGMSYLASKSFVHRDLAARNILLSEDKICKIRDFGMSRNLMDENYYVSHGGKVPIKWTAPEAIHYKKYSTANDVWSFGCVMYEIWSLGHAPFESHTNTEVARMVDEGFRLPPPPGLSKELYKIMIQCWQPESSRRPTFPQLVEMLSRADFELFAWEEEDLRSSDPQVKVIGAPLETAKNLYPELQKKYLYTAIL